MLNAAYLTAGFAVLAVGARYILAGRHPDQARSMMRMALGLLAVLAPLQLLLGDLHGLNTLKHQPVKIAAIEAHWETGPGDFHLFAWPDEKAEENRYAVSIPQGSSLILTHRLNGSFTGLKAVPPEDRPPVKTVFFAFRIMLVIGLFMIATALVGMWLLWRGVLFETRWYLAVAARSWWTGFVAVAAGWVVTESGRQPWTVYGQQRTVDATSPVAAPMIASSLALFVIVYAVVFATGIYYINRLIAKGPDGRLLARSRTPSPAPLAGAREPIDGALAGER
jgi:cytochrome d ubiquinol oxidase subunit I